MLLNIYYVEFCSILCIQFVLCMCYPFMKKRISHLAYIFISSYESCQHLTNFLNRRKNNIEIIAHDLRPFRKCVSLFVILICDKILNAKYSLAVRRKLEFVFRILNYILKNVLSYFYFMDYYNTFQKKEYKSGVTQLTLFLEGHI